MLILSALVVFANARFGGSSGYDEYAYQARLISVLRNMQTRAMNDTRDGYCFQINFDNVNDAFGPPTLDYIGLAATTCSTTIDVGNTLSGANKNRFQHMYALAAELNEDNVDMAARNSAGTTINNIRFDSLGRPTPQLGNCSSGCTIEFTSSVSTARVCVESEGYIHGGNCGG